MPDLRERLRRIEIVPPPDVWADVAARAREDAPTDEPTVIPFGRTTSTGRRVVAGLVAAAVFAAGAVLAWQAFRSAPVVDQMPAALPEGWEPCENRVVGYTIGYPGAWHTTDILIGTQDPSFACRWFSTEPFDLMDDDGRPQGNVVTEGWAYPMEVGVTDAFDEAVTFRTTPEPDTGRLISLEELTVDGHRAVRLEYEITFVVIGEPGMHYEYLIELDAERTLTVHATDTVGDRQDYAANKAIVDQAVETLQIADPLPGTLPAGWRRCANDREGFEIGYPGDWYTTNIVWGERDPAYACRVFAAVPFTIVDDEGREMGSVAEEGCPYAICVRLVPESLGRFADELADPERTDVLAREELEIGGRRAIRLDRIVRASTLGEGEGAYYHYLIELAPHLTIEIMTPQKDSTVGVGSGPDQSQQIMTEEDFPANRAVVDQMAHTLVFWPRT